ncbi:ribonuclease HII [Aurantimonas sp. VKM B-3413]|uniref:ribonuclease HII n=1 Tax=Aurantimonas sp. VKM B-3413 TaxID=2779401 RepID=UPI001E3D9595|nr:ribonuclease HII [Aurantimonas sp. VKM B-3413]MCB8838757.1 ribonuclease HII [Aurantimonas sp. VKM B-3413]
MTRRSSDSPAPSKTARKAAPRPPCGPDFGREAALLSAGARHVAGIDEAGRGPLAGPVVAAAVILDPARMPNGLNDSKKLVMEERERLFAEILASACVGFASASALEIDRFNIRGATLLAMRRALQALGQQPCHVLVDGRDLPPRLSCPGTAVISGDALSLSIAAASIVAKVARDRMMRRACPAYDGYGFSRHMGYGTAEHLAAIERLGPCPIHRLSFRPLRADLLDAAE